MSPFDLIYWVRCCKEESLLSSVELIKMNYKRLDPLGRGYIGSRNDAARLVVQPYEAI